MFAICKDFKLVNLKSRRLGKLSLLYFMKVYKVTFYYYVLHFANPLHF